MKIAIVEICSPNHYVLVETWVSICKTNNWDYTLFLSKDVMERIRGIDGAKVMVVKSIPRKALNQYDRIIFTSIQTKLLQFFFYRPKSKYYVSVHNANTWINGPAKYSFKSLFKRVIRKKILSFASGIFVNNSNIKDFIRQSNKSIKILVVPFMLKEKVEGNLSAEKSIVYPGMVSKKRKKYDLFLKAAEAYPEYQFILLGSINAGEDGYDIVHEIESKHIQNITYFKDYVSPGDYDRMIRGCMMLFSDLKVNFTKEDYTEVYGSTKDSGISYNMIKYEKPALIHSDYHNHDELAPITLYFDDIDSLKKQIDSMSDLDLTSDLRKSTDLFSKEIIAERLRDEL